MACTAPRSFRLSLACLSAWTWAARPAPPPSPCVSSMTPPVEPTPRPPPVPNKAAVDHFSSTNRGATGLARPHLKHLVLEANDFVSHALHRHISTQAVPVPRTPLTRRLPSCVPASALLPLPPSRCPRFRLCLPPPPPAPPPTSFSIKTLGRLVTVT